MGIYSDLAKKPSPTPQPGVKKDVGNASKITSKQVNKLSSKQTSKQDNLLESYLKEKAVQLGGFRYPPSLIELIDDTLYHVKKDHKVKLTKNSIAVLGIANLLKEYEKKGTSSLLYKLLIEGK